MLAVVAVAFVNVVAALVGNECKNTIGIHVPHFAVRAVIGALKSSPQIIITPHGVVSDNVIQLRFERFAGSGGIVVISGRWLGSEYRRKEYQKSGDKGTHSDFFMLQQFCSR